MNQHSASVTQARPAIAMCHASVVLQHIDLVGIRQFVDEEPAVLMGLIKLALTSGRDQIAAVNLNCGHNDAPAQRLAIHNLLNTFNFLHAKTAMVTARCAERHVAASFKPLGALLLAELNEAYRAVESDLEKLLLAGHSELRAN